ncbi:MAG: hypothetical protein HC817_13570 [Saprospiraceae bacterium]|nr:hypothetical protein [Saprospiraceae bacterium]
MPATLSFADGQNGMRTLTVKYDNGRRLEIDLKVVFRIKSGVLRSLTVAQNSAKAR